MDSIASENLFKLQCLIKTTEIQHSVQCKLGRKLFFALATSNADIILYFKKGSSCSPVIKRIPWFQGLHKQIAAFCFDPSGIWLLCITLDGSMYILPALTLVSENNITDKRWKTNDLTYIPLVNSQLSHFRPIAITWWKDTKMSKDVGIIGTECGTVMLVNLLNGQQIGVTHIDGSIHSLHICQNENKEDTSLLITSKLQQQWRLPLEQHKWNLLHNFESNGPCKKTHTNAGIESFCDNIESSVSNNKSTKQRELKQLSIKERLAILKLKLTETKSQMSGESSQSNRENDNGIFLKKNHYLSEIRSEINKVGFINPELVPKDTYLTSQYDREGQQLYTCYHPVTNYITVHGPNLTVIPLSIHKIFQSCETILLAHKFFFITDVNQHVIYIVSDQLSEAHVNKDSKFNFESIVGTFSFKSSKEVIRAIYKVAKFNNVSKKILQEMENKCTVPKIVKDIKIEVPSLDACIIVTNRCVYEVILRKSLLAIFMELVLKKNELQKAGKLAMIFGLNGQHLFEYAGDIFLSNKEFSRAIASYKMSKCKLLKSVLKFASVGHTSELLSCLTHCLLTPVITEMPVATRIHLSNLCILAFIEMTLRVWSLEQSKAIYKEFLYFLSTNTFYDELLAINIAGQTYLWEILHHLATQRCLYGQTLEILMKAVQMFGTDDFHSKPYGLLICLSESDLMQAMLLNHELARSHMLFVHNNLRDFQMFVLQRLVTLYDPTNPVLRPKLIQCKTRQEMTQYNAQSSQCDLVDITDNIVQTDTLVEEIVETFILVLLTLIHKKRILNPNYKHNFLYDMQLPEICEANSTMALHIDFKRRSLSAGFSHVAVVRNGNVYTWGSSVQGCLGTGSSILRYGAPHAVCFFRSMEIEVYSVSCGHCHTLAVTNNGIYAWGSSQFGQLGLGRVLQCSSPELIATLAQEIIVDAVAGQYHSVALTADGRIFTWGWGVHGQLGHGNIDEKATPTLVAVLLGVVVCQVSAGYAHTLALSVDGVVYAFGSNVLGQLGAGSSAKSSVPIKVSLSDGITFISTGYFHNLAVSNTNRLYTWGASPQVLRLQVQAQKRTRILEQQDAANERKNKVSEEPEKSDTTNLNEETKELTEDSVQTDVAKAEVTDFTATPSKSLSEDIDSKDLNGQHLIEENQAHLKPSVVDTSLVKGQITQVSAGGHHNALITKDGSLYTWGRNLDGQIGNGTRREVPIPTPLYYNSACIFAQIPPRQNSDLRRMERDADNDVNKSSDSACNESASENNNENIINASKSVQHAENVALNKERINPVINAVGIACGYDYTIAIQPGGTVLAWGNNSRAQLGRIPAKESRDADDKLVLLKSSKRVVRVPTALHVALDIPSQVPGISTPVISYRSNDASSLAGLVRPLSVIEKSPGELTLHYVLQYFHGLYRTDTIVKKCVELENYQASSKLAALEGNILTAFTCQLKILHKLSLQSSGNYSTPEVPRDTTESRTAPKDFATTESATSNNIKKNTELFNRQAEKNLMESLENSVTRNWMKIPTSRSLNNLQSLAQELYTFDCQGGSEELCGPRKGNEDSSSHNANRSDIETETGAKDENDEQRDWIENLIYNENESLLRYKDGASVQNLPRSTYKDHHLTLNIHDNQTDRHADQESGTRPPDNATSSRFQRNYVVNETIKVLKFYLNNINNEEHTLKCAILQSAINFWVEHNLPMESLENVFLEHIHIIYYPLGLLLFCQNSIEKYLDVNNGWNDESNNQRVYDLFSFNFCLKILSMLMQHIDKGDIMPEYIRVFSSLMADNYGVPLNGYPGTSRNNNPEQMMEGIVSTVLSEMENAKLFAHIKDSDAANRLLMTEEEDSMIFTCGHHFPMSVYEADIIPTMETELLTSSSLILPCTSQYLGNYLYRTPKPEILCPLCIVGGLKAMMEKSYE